MYVCNVITCFLFKNNFVFCSYSNYFLKFQFTATFHFFKMMEMKTTVVQTIKQYCIVFEEISIKIYMYIWSPGLVSYNKMLNRPLQRAKEICKVAYTVEVLLCNVMQIWNEVFVNISRSGLLKHSDAIYFYILHIEINEIPENSWWPWNNPASCIYITKTTRCIQTNE